MRMSFDHDGRITELVVQEPVQLDAVALNEFLLIAMEATTYLIQPTEVERPGDQPVVTDDRPDLCVLLDEFGDPTRLPPRRSHDHNNPPQFFSGKRSTVLLSSSAEA